jgi:hypothetical protein
MYRTAIRSCEDRLLEYSVYEFRSGCNGVLRPAPSLPCLRVNRRALRSDSAVLLSVWHDREAALITT